MTRDGEAGFSMLEMTAAMTIMLAATAGVFALVLPSSGTLAAQSEAADMQQRLRVASDVIAKDLVMAAPTADGSPAIRPYRYGAARPDPPGTFRADAVTVLLPSPIPGGVPGKTSSATYWQQSDPATGTYQLLFYDGSATGSDVPVVDHVVALTFEYYGDAQPGGPGLTKLTAAQLTDGPWLPDAGAADRWDADLARIRRVAVTLRVESAVASLRGPAGALFVRGGTSRGGHAWLPDIEARFDIAPRNLNLTR